MANLWSFEMVLEWLFGDKVANCEVLVVWLFIVGSCRGGEVGVVGE